MAVRKQILVPADVDTLIRRIAAQRGVSQSAVIVEAVRALPETEDQLARVLAFAGAIKGGPAQLSEEVDQVLYA